MKIIVLLALAFCLSACLRTRSELSAMHKVQEATYQQEKIRQQQEAALSLRFQEIDNQMRQVYGRLETLEASVKSNSKPNNRETNHNQEVWERIKLLEQEIESLKNQPPKNKKTQSIFSRAEEDFANHRWKEAALGFERYRNENPKGSNYVLATYKIGVSFEELGEKDNAKLFYQEIIKKFPKHRLYKSAQYRLKNLKLKKQ